MVFSFISVIEVRQQEASAIKLLEDVIVESMLRVLQFYLVQEYDDLVVGNMKLIHVHPSNEHQHVKLQSCFYNLSMGLS